MTTTKKLIAGLLTGILIGFIISTVRHQVLQDRAITLLMDETASQAERINVNAASINQCVETDIGIYKAINRLHGGPTE